MQNHFTDHAYTVWGEAACSECGKSFYEGEGAFCLVDASGETVSSGHCSACVASVRALAEYNSGAARALAAGVQPDSLQRFGHHCATFSYSRPAPGEPWDGRKIWSLYYSWTAKTHFRVFYL